MTRRTVVGNAGGLNSGLWKMQARRSRWNPRESWFTTFCMTSLVYLCWPATDAKIGFIRSQRCSTAPLQLSVSTSRTRHDFLSGYVLWTFQSTLILAVFPNISDQIPPDMISLPRIITYRADPWRNHPPYSTNPVLR